MYMVDLDEICLFSTANLLNYDANLVKTKLELVKLKHELSQNQTQTDKIKRKLENKI